jgi:hypothetical protein
MLVVVTSTPVAQTNPWVCSSGTFVNGTGWAIDIETNGQINLVTLSTTGGQVVGSIGVGGSLGAMPLTLNQIVCFAMSWSADGLTVKCSINGKAVATATTGVAFKHNAPALATHVLGASRLPGNPFDWGRVVAAMRLGRVVSEAELQQISAAPNNDNPYTLPLSNDASCTFSWNAQSNFTAGAPTSISGGTSPVTFTVVGEPTVTDESFTIYDLTSVNFTDSAANQARSSGGRTWAYRSPFARYQFLTDAPQLGVIIASSNFANATSGGLPSAAGIGITVNNGSYRSITADRDTSSAVSGVPAGFTGSVVSIGAAGTLRTIEVTEGGQSNPAAPNMTNVLGTFVTKVRVPAGRSFIPKAITKKGRRMPVLVDSIGVGANAVDLVANCAFQGIRNDGVIEVVYVGAGFRSLYDWYSDDPTYGSLCNEIRSVESNPTEIYIQVGRNDLGLNRWASLVTYQNAYRDMLLALRAEFPLAILWVQCIGLCTDAIYTAGNGFGQTGAQYLAAQEAAFNAAGVSNATLLNSDQAFYGASELSADGIHLTTIGQNTTYYGSTKTAIGG